MANRSEPPETAADTPPDRDFSRHLLGPFRYATQKDFSQLAKVKGLRDVLAHAVQEGRSAGMSARSLAPFEAELEEVDHASLPRRRASVERVLALLQGKMLAVATGKAAPGGSAVASSDPATVRVPRIAATAWTRQQESSAGLGRGAMAPPVAPPATTDLDLDDAPPVRKRRRAVGQEASRSEARLLSIAPRAGPLAVPLKDSGFRVSPRLLGALYKRGLRRVGDVLFLLPRCYEDRRQLVPIAQLQNGERAVVVATVKRAEDVYFRGGRRSFRATVGDDTGTMALTYFRSAPWLKARFPLGQKLVVSGELRVTPAGYEMVHPEIEPADDAAQSPIHFRRLVPIYPGLERQEQRSFRELAFKIVEQRAQHLEDPLPEAIRHEMGLLPLVEALQTLHFPREGADLDALNAHQSPAHQRLAFDELFFLQLGLSLRRAGVQREPGIAFKVTAQGLARARRVVPFALTSAQARAVDEIAADMARPHPMNRMLQGDVGSGKTAVALIAARLALDDGHQVALMAPTEILAAQHHRSFLAALPDAGVVMLKGGQKPAERKQIRAQLASGQAQLVVGTHALFQEEVDLKRLGLVLIDEQHRFGVLQRQALAGKGLRPDVLVMTATPIPRTLAMTLYGDLSLSVLDEVPPGRTPIETRVFTPGKRPRALEAVREQLSQGRQAYVVYPLVEESEKADMADATRGAAELTERFPEFRVGLLHGRMKADEKTRVMDAFRKGELQLLVSTTVIEVGVDVSNASVMVIEAAERFGLSQLHQLRGRVGRGAAKSFCFLLPSRSLSGISAAAERLGVLAASSDGFVIAEKDLELRGPGEFLGTRQSGIPELAVANLARDGALLAHAQRLAQGVVATDPTLSQPGHHALARALEERWEGRLALARVA